MEYQPSLINVVAGKARVSVDLRSPDKEVLMGAENSLMHFAMEATLLEDCKMDVQNLTLVDPVDFDTRVVNAVEQSASSLGYSSKRMLSGAGHDAQLMAGLCPSAMIFIPSVKGISHSVDEFSRDEDIIAGANVLLNTVMDLAGMN